jgi:hypothetical protein
MSVALSRMRGVRMRCRRATATKCARLLSSRTTIGRGVELRTWRPPCLGGRGGTGPNRRGHHLMRGYSVRRPRKRHGIESALISTRGAVRLRTSFN